MVLPLEIEDSRTGHPCDLMTLFNVNSYGDDRTSGINTKTQGNEEDINIPQKQRITPTLTSGSFTQVG